MTTRREFLGAVGSGAVALALPKAALGASPEELARRIIEQHAIDRRDPWVVVHGIRALGRGFALGSEDAVDYVLTSVVRAREINGRSYLYVPREVETHSNSFLKTLLEAGVPLEREARVADRPYRLKDLAEGARAFFGFHPSTFDRDNLAWSLIAFAELGASEWTNAYSERIRLKDLVAFGFRVIEEGTDGMAPYARADRPLPQKFPVHRLTCGGTHLAYSLVVAARRGFADGYASRLKAQLDLLVYRLWADPELIDRFFARFPPSPGADASRLEAKLKFVGHAFEVLHYARRHGLFEATAVQRARMEEALAGLHRTFRNVAALDLNTVKAHDPALYSLFVGDLCHAYRGVRLA